MTVFQWIVSISNVMANVAVVIGVPLSIAQLMKMQKDRLEKRTRDLRQSTIEFWNRISGEIADFANDVLFDLDDNDLSYAAITSDKILHRRVRRYLSLMEQLAVGINSGMYNDIIFERLYGYTTLELYSKLRPYIEADATAREERNANKHGDAEAGATTEVTEDRHMFFYGEFNRLVKRLGEIRAAREKNDYEEKSEEIPPLITD